MTDLIPVAEANLDQIERHAIEAVAAIESVQTPEQAEELLRRITAYQQAVKLAKLGREQEQRWGRIRLMAQRKMGELLGPAEHSRAPEVVTGSNDPPAERKRQHEARKVAAVSEEVFTEYLETAEEPTRAGLLRTAESAPGRKARRVPLPDAAARAGWDLRKAVERAQRVVEDDRYPAHRAAVNQALRPHIAHAIEICRSMIPVEGEESDGNYSAA